jgi:dienelactone hydrolase
MIRIRARLPLAISLFLALSLQAADPPFYHDKFDLLYHLDAKGERHPVRNKEDWEKRRRHILENMQLVMGPLPNEPKPPLDVQVIEEVDFGDLVRRKISYQAKKDDRVRAYLFIPKGREGPRPAMICPHPTSVKFGKGIPAGVGGRPRRANALELAERGSVTIAPDYVYMGEPQKEPHETGYVSGTMKGIYNHMRAIDLLQSMPEVDPERIGTIGHSLGGHNSLFLAAFDSRVKVIVSSCGFNSFPRYYEGRIKPWGQTKYMPRVIDVYQSDPAQMPFDFTEVLGALAPRPVFINAPLGDNNFEVFGVRQCVAAATPVYVGIFGAPDRLVAQYPDAGHDFPDDIREKAYLFIERWLAR